MLLNANKAINKLQTHIQSMMKVSAKYGKSMGTMGTSPFNSARGSTFANETARMMASDPSVMKPMMSRIMGRAEEAGMSSKHMDRMNELYGRVLGETGNIKGGIPEPLRWI